MPLYEEKLISPLSVRFTQSHIRDVFRDSRIVEETIADIITSPSTCEDYDLVIQAPFPNIEIIRWYLPDEEQREQPDYDHWFTLDNRRLYCLQRVAASLWPKRVAAVVELLYAAPNSVKRKEDTTSAGRNVNMGHNTKTIFSLWDWRQEAGVVRCKAGHEINLDNCREPWACDSCRRVCPTQERFRCLTCDYDLCRECHATEPRTLADRRSGDAAEIAAAEQVDRDDGKTAADQLVDMNCLSPASRLMRHMVAAAAQQKSPETLLREAASTAPGSTPSSGSKDSPRSGEFEKEQPWPAFTGVWHQESGETYEVVFDDAEANSTCLKTDAEGKTVAVALRYDSESHALWLGAKWNFYVELTGLSAVPASLQWRTGMGKQHVRFTWTRGEEELAKARPGKGKKGKGKGKGRGAKGGGQVVKA